MDLVAEVYRVARLLPNEELYGLGSQLRRCAVSIPANIAEGYGRASRKEYVQFLSIAGGSHAELETLLELTNRLYPSIDVGPAYEGSEAVGQLLYRLRQSLLPKG